METSGSARQRMVRMKGTEGLRELKEPKEGTVKFEDIEGTLEIGGVASTSEQIGTGSRAPKFGVRTSGVRRSTKTGDDEWQARSTVEGQQASDVAKPLRSCSWEIPQ